MIYRAVPLVNHAEITLVLNENRRGRGLEVESYGIGLVRGIINAEPITK